MFEWPVAAAAAAAEAVSRKTLEDHLVERSTARSRKMAAERTAGRFAESGRWCTFCCCCCCCCLKLHDAAFEVGGMS